MDRREPLIQLAKEPKRVYEMKIPACDCRLPDLPPSVRQMRGSVSLLLCSGCGCLRRK